MFLILEHPYNVKMSYVHEPLQSCTTYCRGPALIHQPDFSQVLLSN